MVIFSSRVGEMDVKLGGSEIGRKSQNIKVIRMKLPISGNIPRPAGSVLRTFPASHEPYCEKSENPEKWKIKQIGEIPLIGVRGFPRTGYFVPGCDGTGAWQISGGCSRIACAFRSFLGPGHWE